MSGPRFATYVSLAGGDRDRAVELYHRTGDVAGGLMADFRALEVLLRNRIDKTMSERVANTSGAGEWFKDSSWVTTGNYLDRQAISSVDRARETVQERTPRGTPVSRGKIVAALSFGFWKRPTHARYEESFWISQAL